MEELEKAGEAVRDVNHLFTTIKSKVETAMGAMRLLGAAEARKKIEEDKINFALSVLIDMQDRLEKPAVIIKELRDKLNEIEEPPF